MTADLPREKNPPSLTTSGMGKGPLGMWPLHPGYNNHYRLVSILCITGWGTKWFDSLAKRSIKTILCSKQTDFKKLDFSKVPA